jgi:peroxiredoxin
MPALTAGTRAPDFSLPATPDQKISLSDFPGKAVALVFYPADWSPVCTDQLALYSELLEDIHGLEAELLAISVDGVWCHLAFAKDRHYRLPLLSDFEPKGAVAKSYGVYREEEGISERALFVIDRDRIIRWSYVSPIGVNPGADGMLKALEEFSGKVVA